MKSRNGSFLVGNMTSVAREISLDPVNVENWREDIIDTKHANSKKKRFYICGCLLEKQKNIRENELEKLLQRRESNFLV